MEPLRKRLHGSGLRDLVKHHDDRCNLHRAGIGKRGFDCLGDRDFEDCYFEKGVGHGRG